MATPIANTLQMHAIYSPLSSDHVVSGRHTSTRPPLDSMPSPTLTNPDMLLPRATDLPSIPSPPQHNWRERPPSPSYLRERASESPQLPQSNSSSRGDGAGAMAKKERRGLMSRKMMLLRSRTASANGIPVIPRSAPPEVASNGYGSNYASSPTLMDVGNLAPEQTLETIDYKRMSIDASSLGSDDLAGMPQFLAKYEQKDEGITDDEWDDGGAAAAKYGYSVSIEGGLDERRRQQEEDEHNSAILSKRAEAILANAKKRLNLMEGNLRGARDLVAPLTAANLKRATSVGSSHVTSTALYGGRSRTANGITPRNASLQQPPRALHAQASSPAMGRDYHHQGHWRGFSETEIPERPHTALERTNSPVRTAGRIPVNPDELPWTNTLRGSKSYDSLSYSVLRRPASREPLYTKGSPDPNLEPLAEDDGGPYRSASQSSWDEVDRQNALGLYRSPSRTDDLREQMSSLKGKISTLKERAREDSLRRQSLQNLREPSPLNNATVNAPEYFYTSSQNYGSPVLDTNAGIGWTSPKNSPQTPSGPNKMWESSQPSNGSRKGLTEPTHKPQTNSRGSNESARRGLQKTSRNDSIDHQTSGKNNGRTSLARPVVDSSTHRHRHRHNPSSGSSPLASEPDRVDETAQSVGGSNGDLERGARDLRRRHSEQFSEPGASVYEDAATEPAPLVAHEDRADAFDYEHFFLHSAMGSYSKGGRRGSGSSGDSVETARGPTHAVDEDVEQNDIYDDQAAYETPEKLKEIERNLHKRTLSDESVSTLATFATATEGRDSPTRLVEPANWPIPAPWSQSVSRPSSQPGSRPASRPGSRPGTAVPIKRADHHHHRRNSSSERADSGVGLTSSSSSHVTKTSSPPVLSPSLRSSSSPATASTTDTISPRLGAPIISPPMSPHSIQHDPATLAVNAVLASSISGPGTPLGLKDKALLFGLVESLRRVAQRLQEAGSAAGREGEFESRVLRKRLEDARKVLDGIGI